MNIFIDRGAGMGHIKGLKCRECSREYPVEPIYVCEFCFGPLEVAYDYTSIAKAISRKQIEKEGEEPLAIP